MIRFLEWDSQFFKKRIFRIDIDVDIDRTEKFGDMIEELKSSRADGAYIVFSDRNEIWENRLHKEGLTCVDEKVIFGKALKTDRPGAEYEFIQNYKDVLNDDLRELSWLAGGYSRFRTDDLLKDRFEDLYTSWMEKSLTGEMADEVLVYKNGSQIAGVVTVKLGGDMATIGLLAIHPSFQGKGIGKKLVAKAESDFVSLGAKNMQVATQLANLQACSFYSKCGFQINSVTPIYHIWF